MRKEMKISKIKNEYLEVTISNKGAELQSITDNKGNERLWYGDEKFWAGRAPVLFPVCGGLMNDMYFLDGKKYTMPKHGFAKESIFMLENIFEDSCTYLLTSNSNTKLIYPYDFELRVKYSLIENSVAVDYIITNKTGQKMYCAIGGHEAYLCKNSIEDYYIEFEKEETLDTYEFDGSYPNGKKRRIITASKIMPLKYKDFEDDTLMFDGLKSSKVYIVHKNGKKTVEVLFNEFKYLLFWTVPNAPYICIEPWTTMPDSVNSNMDFKSKKDNICINPYEEYKISHTIKFID